MTVWTRRWIKSSLGGNFPNIDARYYTPFPINRFDTFTPFNQYDVWFFLTWFATFLIYFYIFSRMRNKNSTKSVSPKDQLKPKQETPRTNESETSSIRESA
jgi:hypothetical protein